MPARSHRIRAWLLSLCGAKIGSGVCLNANVLVYSPYIEIDDKTWVSSETIFYTGSDGPVKIGSHCDIGPGVMFVTGSHSLGDSKRRASEGFAEPIVIGNGCWIGARSLILGGVTIGDGCVIAAGAVVVPGEYPSHVLLTGVPAIIKKTFTTEP